MGTTFFSAPGIRQATPLPTPYAFWPMNEGTGSTLNDAIGSIDLAIVDATWVSTGRNSTNCLSFADTQHAWVADPFYLSGALYIAAWINSSTTGVAKNVICKRNNSTQVNLDNEFAINVTSTETITFQKYSPTIYLNFSTTDTITVNTWTHICVGSGGNGTTAYIYINGVEKATLAESGTLYNGASVFNIAGRSATNATRYFNGKIQEVRLYDQALTAEQVTAIYNLPPP